MRGDVVFVNLPPPRTPPSHVQAGRRPAVVLHSPVSQGQLPVTLVVPGTSNRHAQRFPHTVLVTPTAENGLASETVFLCFQVMPADKGIVETPPIGKLAPEDLQRVEVGVREALGL